MVNNHCFGREIEGKKLISKRLVLKVIFSNFNMIFFKLPIRWMAPETIQRHPRYSHKSDIWSFGVLFYEIFNNGIKPWPDLDVRQCATNIRRGTMPEMPGSIIRKIKKNDFFCFLNFIAIYKILVFQFFIFFVIFCLFNFVIKNKLIADRMPKEIIKLVNKCWKLNVEKRCDFKYVVKKLKKLQQSYAPPETSDLTIGKLKNVRILTEEAAEIQEEKDDCMVEMLFQRAKACVDNEKETNETVIKPMVCIYLFFLFLFS